MSAKNITVEREFPPTLLLSPNVLPNISSFETLPTLNYSFRSFILSLNNCNRPPSLTSLDRESLLRDEFDRLPVWFIKNTVKSKKRLRDAYMDLADATAAGNPQLESSRVRKRAKASNVLHPESHDAEIRAVCSELAAVREEREKKDAEAAAVAHALSEEMENEQESRAAGEIRDCACCFGETPNNRMGYCRSEDPHYFCLNCIKMNAETEIGNNKCRPKCMDMSGCQAEFPDHFLRRSLEEKTFDRLIRNQRNEDLKKLGVDGIEECPFCDSVKECHPIEVDREFRCEDPGCGRTSCRLCHNDAHTPFSCDEAKERRSKENRLHARHMVEEAMTSALVRSCNKCNTPFVKIEGCNKMTCNRCGNKQCYACSANITGYEHFGNGGLDGKCPAYDDRGVEVQHQEEVRRAEKAAADRVRAEQPEIEEEDLTIKVSDAVKRSEEQQARRNPRDEWFPPPHQFPLPLGPILGLPQAHQRAGAPIELFPAAPAVGHDGAMQRANRFLDVQERVYARQQARVQQQDILQHQAHRANMQNPPNEDDRLLQQDKHDGAVQHPRHHQEMVPPFNQRRLANLQQQMQARGQDPVANTMPDPDLLHQRIAALQQRANRIGQATRQEAVAHHRPDFAMIEQGTAALQPTEPNTVVDPMNERARQDAGTLLALGRRERARQRMEQETQVVGQHRRARTQAWLADEAQRMHLDEGAEDPLPPIARPPRHGQYQPFAPIPLHPPHPRPEGNTVVQRNQPRIPAGMRHLPPHPPPPPPAPQPHLGPVPPFGHANPGWGWFDQPEPFPLFGQGDHWGLENWGLADQPGQFPPFEQMEAFGIDRILPDPLWPANHGQRH